MADSYVITCCSTADMPASYMEAHSIPYARFHFRMDGREYEDDLGASISFEEFYKKIDEGAMPTTAQVNPEQYRALFEPILAEGKDVLHLALSSGISGSVGSSRIAAQTLSEKYPDRRIEVIDSLCASVGYGLLVDTALERQAAGEDLSALSAWITENRTRLHHWFTTSDLTHFRRGGRVSASAAFFGNMLNICPIMQVSRAGTLIPQEKCRGTKKSLRELKDRMVLHAQEGAAYPGKCFVGHSARPEEARYLANLIEEAFPQLAGKILITSIGTVIGSHTGPGTVVVVFWGDEREV